ncbi:MAG: sugar phosphate isomerase/epimerase family protein [Isosphaeraceae bacterium]|nr:sugar phosphate isomerase/epimerase family protein [Isosphaeraceae bacterium]
MVTYGHRPDSLERDLALAEALGASEVEILPDWGSLPDAATCRSIVADRGLVLRSAHGSWGRQSISGRRVDPGDPAESTRVEAVDDLRACADWLIEAGGTHLVVHPGGHSARDAFDSRRAALIRSLLELSAHVRDSGLLVCVENMPPGVHPGSRMTDLAAIVSELEDPAIRLILDTGHAQLGDSLIEATAAAAPALAALHVHDNDGRTDSHLPPGMGVIDWGTWIEELDRAGYTGPIMLECIRKIRDDPSILNRSFLTILADLTNDPRVIARRDASRSRP